MPTTDILTIVRDWAKTRDEVSAQWRFEGSVFYAGKSKTGINVFTQAMDRCTNLLMDRVEETHDVEFLHSVGEAIVPGAEHSAVYHAWEREVIAQHPAEWNALDTESLRELAFNIDKMFRVTRLRHRS